MELLEGGQLSALVHSRGQLPERDARAVMTSVLQGLAYLHSPQHRIVHRGARSLSPPLLRLPIPPASEARHSLGGRAPRGAAGLAACCMPTRPRAARRAPAPQT